MNTWWYAENDKKIGPIETNELKRLLQTGKVNGSNMIWREGMDSWRPLEEIEELRSLKATVPPPLVPKLVPDPLSYSLATAWPRFFARIFDLWWEVLLTALILGFVLGRYSASFVGWINGPGASQLFGIMCIPIALIIDAVVYRVTGNTPGKALLGLHVGTLKASPLSFAQYLSRNFGMWTSGLALGFPLFNLFTMARQSNKLAKGQQTSYDEFTGFRVRAKPLGWVRKVAFGISFAGLFAVMAALNAIEQTTQREESLSTAQKNYVWVNPSTQQNAQIDSGWKYKAQPNDDGQQVHMFTERTDHAVVIFAAEEAPGYALHDYVSAFQKGTVNSMHFSDGGRFLEKEGRQTWQGNGSMVDSTESRLKVEIVQIDSAFWRVVTIQSLPYEYSDALAGQLGAVLWATVK